MTAPEINWLPIEQALRSEAAAALELPAASVVWTKGNVPELEMPHAWWHRVSRSDGPVKSRRFVTAMLTQITVASVQPATLYSIEVHEGAHLGSTPPASVPHSYTSGPAPTPASIVAGLMATFPGGGWPTAAAHPTDAASFYLYTTVQRPLMTAALTGNLTQRWVTGGAGWRSRWTVTATYRFQAKTQSERPETNAERMVGRVYTRLAVTGASWDAIAGLALFVGAGDTIDLTALENERLVTRCARDFTFEHEAENVEYRNFVRAAEPTDVQLTQG